MSTSGKYEIRIKASAEREMDSLSTGVLARLSKAILGLESSPRPAKCKKLRGRHEYRLRVGAYRILYTIDDTTRIVEIVAVRHRRDAYR
ncbi:MAG: type II toxin-antitoxin system RelE/ParE family toxin [Planctomycetota bacterium]